MIETTAIAAAASGVMGLITGLGLMARRWSRDKLELAKDRAEADLINDLVRQRDYERDLRKSAQEELNKVAIEADQALQTVRELTAKTTTQSAQIDLLTSLVKRQAATLETAKAQLQAALHP